MNEVAMQNDINDLSSRVKELEKQFKQIMADHEEFKSSHSSKAGHTTTHHGKDEKHK